MAGNQLGKELRHDEPVLTPTGWVEIKNLTVGDEVIAGDGSVTTVTGFYPQGVKPLVEIEFCYGTKIVAGYEHLWRAITPANRFRTKSLSLPRVRGEKRKAVQIENPNHGEWGVFRTADMRAHHGDNPASKYRYAVPAVDVAALTPQPVTINPYVLGVLLGDGSVKHNVGLSSADASIVEAFCREAARHNCWVRKCGGYDYAASTNTRGANKLLDALRELGVHGKGAADKRVPPSYMWNSAVVRLAVLQGLMDTDGTCEKSGAMSFTSISPGLAEDVAFLARSFGAKCYITSRITGYTHNGEKRRGQRAYTVVIRCPHAPLFRLERKLDRCIRPISTTDHHLIVGFRDVEPDEAFCISVAHPDKTYVTRDFIVTHNTVSGAAETAMHLTGRYPDWWPGRRWDRPITAIAGSVSSELTRDGVQRLLVGPPKVEGEWGTGYVPKDFLMDWSRRSGVADALDSITVRHVSGGVSTLLLKSYDQGRDKWQANTVDLVWLDEEPPKDVYSEAITRTTATAGSAFLTFTPLLGMSEVVRRFLSESDVHRAVVTMTIHDAGHISPEECERIIKRYPEHEREARANGVPILGSGRIFPIADSRILTPPFEIPRHWPVIGGLDFGWDHPTAAVKLAYDRDNDIIYLTREHRLSQATPKTHVVTIGDERSWGAIPWAWPHDGEIADKGSGIQLAKQYRSAGLRMLDSHATFSNGSNSVEAGVLEMLERMNDGRWKVFDGMCPLWMEEFRLYHRDDGKIVKKYDDVICASRYAMMMIRHARIVHMRRDPFGFDGLDGRGKVALGVGEVNW